MIHAYLMMQNTPTLDVDFYQDHFPCGESLIRLGDDAVRRLPRCSREDLVHIIFEYKSNDDLINLMLLHDAITSLNPVISTLLTITYFPYGRQDRRSVQGEPHSLKVVSRMINSMEFNTVQVFDPHSDVIEALIDRVQIIPCVDLCYETAQLREYDFLVSPDAGAYKKVTEVAKRTQIPVIRGDKIRDPLTGKLSSITVHSETNELVDKKVLIIDDICDGGGTFTGLGKELKMKGASQVDLFVTHGMFTKGVPDVMGVLPNQMIDVIFCAFYYGPESDSQLVHQVKPRG